jgi:hypothetical protein
LRGEKSDEAIRRRVRTLIEIASPGFRSGSQ